MTNQFLKKLNSRKSDTSMIFEFSSFSFFSSTKKPSSSVFVHLYQQKVGFILFATITIRSNVTFAISRLKQRNAALIFQNHAAADRIIQYLQYTRFLTIQFGVQKTKKTTVAFICVSDASFADNSNRKSSQGYIMKLFDGFIT